MQDNSGTTRSATAPGARAYSATATAGSAPFRIWPDDDAHFDMNAVCQLHHNFHEHPLMQLDQLEALAKKLMPLNQCRFIKPGTTQKSDFHHDGTSPDGREISEVFRRMEEPGSWIALYNIETDPAYAGFVNDALQTVRHLIERQQPNMFSPQGFIFISAPPSVTPFHIDRENNFWLQIRGRKTMNVWGADDRVTVPGLAVENFIVDKSLSGVKLKEETKERSIERDFGPGDGVYFPSTAPHMTACGREWVTPGDGVSISIGIVFYTDVTRKHAHIHAFNRALRKLGMSPKFPGASPFDGLKSTFGRQIVGVKRRFRDYEPPTGF